MAGVRGAAGAEAPATTQPSTARLSAPKSRPAPLVHAHAHNDYEHARPLLDALDAGFCSVEADVHLVSGKLLVAHDFLHLRPDRTLQSLYLDPLRDRVKQNGGRVYPDGPPVVLLVDFKTDGDNLWPAVRDVLKDKDYAPMLTTWQDGRRRDGAVTVILTGGYPRAAVAAEAAEAGAVRYVACDGTLDDLTADPPPAAELVPWISSSWGKTFAWRGVGEMPPAGRQKLRELADKAHAQGRQIRFWGAPDNPAAWAELRAAGVDWINSDDLKGLQAFFAGRQSPTTVPSGVAPRAGS